MQFLQLPLELNLLLDQLIAVRLLPRLVGEPDQPEVSLLDFDALDVLPHDIDFLSQLLLQFRQLSLLLRFLLLLTVLVEFLLLLLQNPLLCWVVLLSLLYPPVNFFLVLVLGVIRGDMLGDLIKVILLVAVMVV